MKFTLLFAVVLVVPATCNIPKLRTIPAGVQNVDSRKLLGTWYRFAHYIPCGWSGSGKFTDGMSTLSLDKGDPGFLQCVNTWRSSSGMCGRRTERVSIKSLECNKVLSVNNLGGMGSGSRARVAIDYDDYDINWGCAALTFDDPKMCKEPSLSVLVRHFPPTPKTISKINQELRRLFDIDLGQLRTQIHTGKYGDYTTVSLDATCLHVDPASTQTEHYSRKCCLKISEGMMMMGWITMQK